MRVACNTRVKRNEQWEDKANYFDVVCFGSQADNCIKYLAKGRPVAISGRLDWSEWTAQDGSKRQGVQVIAENVQFLSDSRESGSGSTSGSGGSPGAPPGSAAPAPPPPAENNPPFPLSGGGARRFAPDAPPPQPQSRVASRKITERPRLFSRGRSIRSQLANYLDHGLG